MNSLSETLRNAIAGFNIQPESRWLAGQAVVVGAVVWSVIFALKEVVHWLFHQVLHWIEHGPTPVMLFFPLLIGALIVAIIAHFWAETVNYRNEAGQVESLNLIEGDGIERTIALYYSSDRTVVQEETADQSHLEARWRLPTFALAARKFVASVATLGSGGSGGLEAGSALIGEALGAWVYKLRINVSRNKLVNLPEQMLQPWEAPHPEILRAAQLSGVAAAITVLLGTPLAGAFFASEVMYRNRPLLEKLFFTLFAALTARTLSSIVIGARSQMFEVTTYVLPQFGNVRYGLVLILMAVVIAFVGQLYRALSLYSTEWFHRKISNRFVRLLLGAGFTGVIAVTVLTITRTYALTEHGLELVLGSGESMINLAFEGQVTLIVALLGLTAKMLATLSTISSGGSGGLLVPALFFGTMVAAAFAQIFEYEPILLIVPALTASLIAIVNTPFAAILFAVELFGAGYMIPVLVALIVVGLLSNPKSIYRTRKKAPVSFEAVTPTFNDGG